MRNLGQAISTYNFNGQWHIVAHLKLPLCYVTPLRFRLKYFKEMKATEEFNRQKYSIPGKNHFLNTSFHPSTYNSRALTATAISLH